MWKVNLALVSRGSKSRNKVSVGEPAEGSVKVWNAKRGPRVGLPVSPRVPVEQ